MWAGMGTSQSLGGGGYGADEEPRPAAEPEIQMVWPLCLTTGTGAPSLSVKVSNVEAVAKLAHGRCITRQQQQHSRMLTQAAQPSHEPGPEAVSDTSVGDMYAAVARAAYARSGKVSNRCSLEEEHDFFGLRTESNLGLTEQLASLPDMRVCFMVSDCLPACFSDLLLPFADPR
jgi:hypothetical protein